MDQNDRSLNANNKPKEEKKHLREEEQEVTVNLRYQTKCRLEQIKATKEITFSGAAELRLRAEGQQLQYHNEIPTGFASDELKKQIYRRFLPQYRYRFYVCILIFIYYFFTKRNKDPPLTVN